MISWFRLYIVMVMVLYMIGLAPLALIIHPVLLLTIWRLVINARRCALT